MSQQIWKYLPHVPTSKKPSNILKRKSEITDKEVLNLAGGLFPIKLVQQPREYSQPFDSSDPFVRCPIIQKNPKIGPIFHWVRQSDAKKNYHGDKFNVEPEIITLNQKQYKEAMPESHWNFKKVQQIFQLLRNFNLNFIVVHDRMTYQSNQSAQNQISIEDLKQIYFTVTKAILNLRGLKQQSLLANYVFDKKYEINRKHQLQKFMLREKSNTEQERFLINQIRRLEILIKKEQRQQINLKKALKLDQIPEDHFEMQNAIPDQNKPQNLRKAQKVYTRQQYLSKPLQIPGKTNERLVEVLHGMNIPEKIVATQENQELFDQLRKKILLMFSIQRYIRRKEVQKRVLQEKKKKILVGSDDEDRKKIEGAIGAPRKKINSGTK